MAKSNSIFTKEDKRKSSPCHVVCSFDESKDIAPVEAQLTVTFEDMLISGVVPSDVSSVEFTDVGADPNVIVGRVSNVFQALRVKGYIMASAKGRADNVASAAAAAASASNVSAPSAE